MPLPAGTYPALRARRIGAGGSAGELAGAALAAPPQTRIFPFSLLPGTSLRSSRSSPLLHGPAIVTGFHASKNGTADGVLGFGLGKSLTEITETGAAIATALPFQALFEGLAQAGAGPTSPNNTVVTLDVQASILLDDSNMSLIILDPEFYLVVYAASNASGTPDAIVGYVTILERVSLEALRNFL